MQELAKFQITYLMTENLPSSSWYDVSLFKEQHNACDKVTVNNFGKSLICSV